MKGSVKYCMINDGFKNEILYSYNALRQAAHREGESSAGTSSTDGATSGMGLTIAASSGKGPDLYGPVWITLTLVFFVAVSLPTCHSIFVTRPKSQL